MGFTNRLNWETLRSRNATTFNNTYQAMGYGTTPTVPAPLQFPSYICKLVNNSTVLLTISIDGVTDIDVAPPGSFWLYDESKVGVSGQFPALPAGTQIFVKGAAAGTGFVYLVTQYVV